MIYAIFSEGEYPVEARNQAARAGKLGATIQSILADLKPRLCISPTTMVTDSISFPQNERRFTDPGDCRAVFPSIEWEH